MTFDALMADGYDSLSMAPSDKPYRVYRGGRSKGNVPLKRKSGSSGGREAAGGGKAKTGSRRFRLPRLGLRRGGWKRRVLFAFILLVLLIFVWAIAGYMALRSGAQKANERLGDTAKHALSSTHGLMLSNKSNILVLGTDHNNTAERQGISHSDSIMIVHTDPSRHRIVYLSIPRDLRINVPTHGYDRINVAFQLGGAALAIKTVAAYTGLPINHVIVVDFAQFRQLIDALGGVDINVPKPIFTNAFDCPFTAEKCASWQGYRFAKGVQHMNGRRALVYSRIRENRLDPSETDITRGARQQQVVQAVLSKITSPMTMIKLPWLGDDLLRPMATDLSAGQLMQLGWIKLRASSTLHCRLGGDPQYIGGAREISPTEDNYSVIRMVEGTEPARAPTSLYAPGCSKSALLP
jgi:polyisoprenyl-teichoic acid--peptidoglycan teichoic acid transferase